MGVRLGIAPRTAANHVQNLYTKFGFTTRAAAGVEVAQNVLAETQPAFLPLVPYLDTLRWVFIAVALIGIAVATSWLTGCAAAGFEIGGVGACPPVGECGRGFQTRSAEELAMLPDGSAVVEMMRDYAIMREQARTGPSS